MADRLFDSVTVHYTMTDTTNPRITIARVIEEVIDINACIHQTAKSARLLGMKIDTFTVQVTYD